MSFVDDFNTSFSSSHMINSDFSPQMLITQVYSYPDADDQMDGCMRLEASGSVLVNEFFLIKSKRLDCYMIIFTKAGAFELSHSGDTFNIKSGSLMLMDCSHSFTMRPTTIPWNFRILFLRKDNTKIYSEFLNSAACHAFTLSEYSPVISDICTLTSMPGNCSSSDMLRMHASITSILCQLALSGERRKSACPSGTPKYIQEIKNYMESHYQEKFSLDECAKLYGVNKYKICRDFQSAYGDSPVHYLNSYRLECAKKLLLTDEFNIQEISSMVGFDNVNHFINLFKKVNGVTPGVFRQKAVSETIR